MTKMITFEGISFKVGDPVRYIAKDSCGTIYAYDMEPVCVAAKWFEHENNDYIEILGESLEGGDWWEDSLIKC